MSSDSSHVLLNPRITEKSTWHSAQGVYVFDVAVNSNKQQISRAIRAIYKVTPRKIRIVTVPSKSKRSARTGKLGVKGGGKKAYVYLKKGETINLS
ncbi:50S ribosomal protein L23 [Candidatus Kaiserbacteria bacterium RIFCSPHIGHO2_02_FULL_49_16]|uniref:Large ribosomal subunit protein uL23 n=1 Tax=Candidatus Kaiserbacteria bacterium RIFCSPHIGHO2_02_FULL_49_16 TaxID=1798490 RepID=A0A1F6DFL5_9BACT|nr:MAG: 50S ribosomal protein L23 [Candidatus Kaiserbacteria bacterium RIFCSPHIGHO2_02_FULL_49_16]